jgi:hypothetical protein
MLRLCASEFLGKSNESVEKAQDQLFPRQDLRQAPAMNRQDRDRADPSGACNRYVSNHLLVACDLTPIGFGSDTLSQQ